MIQFGFSRMIILAVLMSATAAYANTGYSIAQVRSLYGNIVGCKVIDRRDAKVNSLNDIPYGMDFVSTNDKTFVFGNVGQYVRDLFKEPSRFEE